MSTVHDESGESARVEARESWRSSELLTEEEKEALREASEHFWCKAERISHGSAVTPALTSLLDAIQSSAAPGGQRVTYVSPQGADRGTSLTLELRLYVAGSTSHSITTLSNLRAAIERRVGTDYLLEVIDVLREPHRALEDGVLGTPTLIKVAPGRTETFVGDLCSPSVVVRILERSIRPEASSPFDGDFGEDNSPRTKNYRIPKSRGAS